MRTYVTDLVEQAKRRHQWVSKQAIFQWIDAGWLVPDGFEPYGTRSGRFRPYWLNASAAHVLDSKNKLAEKPAWQYY